MFSVAPVTPRLWWHDIYLDYLCIIGINLGKNKSKSDSHDKETMYRLSYENSHIILKNMCKFQLIIAQSIFSI